MKKRFSYSLIVLAILMIAVGFKEIGFKKFDYISINNKRIKIEVADNPESRYLGLSGRENLCDDCGMLFIFGEKRERNFVMRNMEFDLDIIWINDGKIIKIDRDLPAEGESQINIYSSENPVNLVLEVNAGFCDKNNIKLGDTIKF